MQVWELVSHDFDHRHVIRTNSTFRKLDWFQSSDGSKHPLHWVCYKLISINRLFTFDKTLPLELANIQSAPGGKVNILAGHSIGHSKQIILYM
jgi:hypothetical protein